LFAWSAVDRGFEPHSGQIVDYEISVNCFYAKHTVLRSKSKYWLAHVPKWCNMDIRELLF
jgi:hypothetical protein